MRQQYARRTQLVMVLISLISLGIIVQMVRIQTSPAAAILKQRGDEFQTEWRTFFPDRGEIYDRTGHLLAGNKSAYEIGVNLNIVKDPEAILAAAASVDLDLDYAEALDAIQNPPENRTFVVIADYVDQEKGLKLQALKDADDGRFGDLTGLEFNLHPMRSYPEKDLA